MMKRLSQEAQLETVYTNHCLRATAIRHMKQSGVEDRKIATVSGHKNLSSLQAYDRTTVAESHAMAAAIDRKPMVDVSNTAPDSDRATADVKSDGKISGFEPDDHCRPGSVLVNAANATFNNVTFVTPVPVKRKPKFCLSLSKRRRNA